ncbi:MAG: ribosome maturation factor RimP [Acutalibacteraceae bacterium]|nr:ribosome maturation factor RimP [Acutalibacteraceae bacterium]
MANIADTVASLIKETVEAQGVSLWDVRFVKEGADWFLRIFIDKADGISIDDCVNVSHAVDPIIDEADPIDRSYTMEVSSPGIERELTRAEHFHIMQGKEIKVKLYKAEDGVKEFIGTLKGYSETLVIETENGEKEFDKKAVAKVYLYEED